MAIVVNDSLSQCINRMREPVLYVRYSASSYECLAKLVFARLVDTFPPHGNPKGLNVSQMYYLRKALNYLPLILQTSSIVAQ